MALQFCIVKKTPIEGRKFMYDRVYLQLVAIDIEPKPMTLHYLKLWTGNIKHATTWKLKGHAEATADSIEGAVVEELAEGTKYDKDEEEE